MKTSVALCTYNGSKYILEQIESILHQTRPVDEIVVCDDGSADDTLRIVAELAAKTNTVIRIYRNESILGPSRNFQKAISLCTGDIVFLSDQDDVWQENKVQAIVDWFKVSPSRSVVFSDADLIDGEGNLVTNQTLWDCIGFSAKAQKSFDDGFGVELFCYENRATGATMAVRKDYAMNSCFVEVCNGNILHDGALAMLALGDDSLGYIPEKLTKYRCHNDQSVGLGVTMLNPLSDDSKETSPLCGIWARQNLPMVLKQRIGFVALRHRMITQRMGLFRMINNRKCYKTFYRIHENSFLNHDISRWRNHFFSNESLCHCS